MEIIENQRFGEERALYHRRGLTLRGCRFAGEEDGESALKECADVAAENCLFDLRYPLWHVEKLRAERCTMTENCRAALWYGSEIRLIGCTLGGIKAVRECRAVSLEDCTVRSPEFGWRCDGLRLARCAGEAEEYAFLETRALRADGMIFDGKYSFQYTQGVHIARSELHTKDAFWHAKDVTVTDSVLCGEYLGWYSEGLTLIRCHIRGTQPLCYCRGLRLVDCTMEGCDLAFEYSDVDATVRGGILSVKNPRGGRIVADHIGEVIRTQDAVYPSLARVVAREKA